MNKLEKALEQIWKSATHMAGWQAGYENESFLYIANIARKALGLDELDLEDAEVWHQEHINESVTSNDEE